MALTVTVQTVVLPDGGTVLRATCVGDPHRGRVIAVVDQAEYGSTDSVAEVLQALAVKARRHGFSKEELS